MHIYAYLEQYYVPPKCWNNEVLINLVAAAETAKTTSAALNRGQISFSQAYLIFKEIQTLNII